MLSQKSGCWRLHCNKNNNGSKVANFSLRLVKMLPYFFFFINVFKIRVFFYLLFSSIFRESDGRNCSRVFISHILWSAVLCAPYIILTWWRRIFRLWTSVVSTAKLTLSTNASFIVQVFSFIYILVLHKYSLIKIILPILCHVPIYQASINIFQMG